MATQRYINNWIGKLTGPLLAGGAELPVAQALLDRLDLSGDGVYTLTLVATLDPLQQTLVEVVTITAEGLARGEEGTTAQDWPADTYVYAGVTSGILSLFGEEGPEGKSAYQSWLAQGNTGSEADFIDDLRGADGADGVDGEPGAPGADGRGIASMDVDGDRHLIITYDDETTHDAGVLPAGAPVGSAIPQALGSASAGSSGNASREDHKHPMPTAADVGAVASAAVGVAGGLATLDGAGKVPAVQLPSFVDDVIEAASAAALPATGESGKIYVTLDNNKTWRWGGSSYIEISPSPGSTDAVAEGSTNLYFTVARVRAVVLAGLDLTVSAAITAADTVLSALGKLQKQLSDHVGAGGSTHAVATTSLAGFMSATDKTKLDGLSGGISWASKSADYTLVLADANIGVLHPSADATARTFTIPANAAVAFPVGTCFTFSNQTGAGVVSIAINSDTMYLAGAGTTGTRTLSPSGMATVVKESSTVWKISGVGLS
ncbi:hypothetical protein [Pseudomonas citronellolis]|uniref:hypothetical protein n=1 Tax=Pseudomonas citronellolis TaxID=53408 RepID=UPI0023E44F72|nr:hypothetical protein [Pseudomonas citronellolis]MDF3931404.1 hypothetical protein [Pseudomonas citronellolis]